MYLFMTILGPMILLATMFWAATHNRRGADQRPGDTARPPVSDRRFLTTLFVVAGLLILAVGVYNLR